MAAPNNNALALLLDAAYGGKTLTSQSACTLTNASNAVTVTGSTLDIPAAGYVSGVGIPQGTTYTLAGTTATLSVNATAGGAGVVLTFSLFPRTYYFALFTVAPTNTGGGTEVVGGAYARVAVDNTVANFPATVASNKTNANPIQFPDSTAAWGSVVAWAVFDAPTAGNMFFNGAVNPTLNLNSGDTAKFAAGTFDLTN
jgi:hypothetical protein